MAKGFAEEERSDIKNVLTRIKKRDFSGYSGLAVKNSIYQFSTSLVTKIGSLLFTIILARILLPELFGLYSLALSTIMIFLVLSDLGINSTLIRYLSKNKKKGAYKNYLFNLKIYLSIIASFILFISAYFIANYYYNKPIFFALLAGGLYILSNNLLGLYNSIFHADNNFKTPFFKEILFQVLRIVVIPISVLLLIDRGTEITILSIIVTLAFCSFLTAIFLNRTSPKYKEEKLTKKEKKSLINFILPLSLLSLSGLFFGYIDIIFLGRFVSSEIIAFYQIALSLVYSAVVIISFGHVFLPIFSRLGKKRLEKGLRKTITLTIITSIIGFILTIVIAPYIVNIIYGAEYSPAVSLLQFFSVIFLIEPLILIYTNYYISQGKNKIIATSLIISTVLNIILNYILITSLLFYGEYIASFGAATATIISKFVYLIILVVSKGR